MEIIVDLEGLKTKQEVLLKFGEVFEFGGPDGNVPVEAINAGKGWGINWDAMNDSLSHLEAGGIWGTSKKFMFPLYMKVVNYQDFAKNDPEGFTILEDILKISAERYHKEHKSFQYTFPYTWITSGGFNQLEKDILQWYKDYYHDANLNAQIDSARFVSREWTKVGFFVNFVVDKTLGRVEIKNGAFDHPWPIEGPQLESPQIGYGGDVLLWDGFQEDVGYIDSLELYAHGDRFDEYVHEYSIYSP